MTASTELIYPDLHDSDWHGHTHTLVFSLNKPVAHSPSNVQTRCAPETWRCSILRGKQEKMHCRRDRATVIGLIACRSIQVVKPTNWRARKSLCLCRAVAYVRTLLSRVCKHQTRALLIDAPNQLTVMRAIRNVFCCRHLLSFPVYTSMHDV